MSRKGFILGTIFGAAAGAAAGILLAPRSGAETRAMASDYVNEAWDSAVDTYEQTSASVADRLGQVKPGVASTTDELRAKVDLARERMDQLRDSLSEAVAATTEQVADAVEQVADKVVEIADAAVDASGTEAEAVKVEVIDESEVPAGE